MQLFVFYLDAGDYANIFPTQDVDHDSGEYICTVCVFITQYKPYIVCVVCAYVYKHFLSETNQKRSSCPCGSRQLRL